MRRLLHGHVWAVYSFLYAPIVVLVLFSFNQSKRNAVWKGFTLDWYRQLFADTEVMTSFGKSLEIAGIATVMATIIGTMAALALSRYRFKGRDLVATSLYLPMVIPEVVMGVSILTFFVSMKVTLGLFTLILAHVAFCISFVTVVVNARLQGFNRVLEEAAADLGASPWVTMWKVTLPLILPGIVSGALLSFTLSFDDFVVTFFNSGAGTTTLPIKVYSMLKFGVTPVINCVSTLMILITFALVLVSQRLQREN
ncbi:MAG TPA: ABC transporter permease subunit [Candidatus Xenobia bacterium]